MPDYSEVMVKWTAGRTGCLEIGWSKPFNLCKIDLGQHRHKCTNFADYLVTRRQQEPWSARA